MIIFYKKTTGDIVGTVGGRVHNPEELKMWVGDPKQIDRIVIEWKPVRWYTKTGDSLPKECLDACDENGNLLINTSDFEPDCDGKIKPLIERIEKEPMYVHENCIFDVKSGELREKTAEEIEKENELKQSIIKENKAKKKVKEDKLKFVIDKTKPIEDRFNNLLDLINLDKIKDNQ
jgi:hypothetical protein